MENIYGVLKEINWGLIAPIIIIQFLLVIIAVIDLIRNKQPNGPKWMWVLIILFINIVGPIIYFIVGRRQNR
ncbi:MULTISPECIES: PLDc N-terminal domain-containing protein [Heyndrickxia]|uniref:PLDc N-terminal domain-containing protein n=1 Tax=Heyndrickxia TaxID=2837504 RepID=UPI001B25B451|nr:PLD nuclease N-terminal domain-containing protein [Heyndrickxia oleronia]GIN40407.1 negative regulatory protein YxlE [Heyndrickxia oleronia]